MFPSNSDPHKLARAVSNAKHNNNNNITKKGLNTVYIGIVEVFRDSKTLIVALT